MPSCPALDGEVELLHTLARDGAISDDHAERQLNTYLLAASRPRGLPVPDRWLLLPLTDAPHQSNLPDLGQALHHVLARDPVRCALSAVLEQSIPSLRHTTRAIGFADSQQVLLNLLMAFALGTLPPPVKKPCFAARATLFARVHAVLASEPAAQSRFLSANEDTVLLACMEYLARVAPVHMPAQAHALSQSNGFFRRIPGLCDELRQALDDEPDMPWPRIRARCSDMVERVSRLKRCHRMAQPREQQEPVALADVTPYWEAPLLPHGTPEEFALLALSVGLDPGVLQHVQRDLQVYALPSNLRDIQLRCLLEAPGGTQRTAFLRTRRFVCMRCLLTNRQANASKLRLDTLSQRLTCSACMGHDILPVDMLGRAMRLRGQHFFLCPACVSVQEYRGRELVWADGRSCDHRPRREPASRARAQCTVCSEPAGALVLERVDHLTGEMHQFHYCQRHTPRADLVAEAVNARLLGQTSSRIRRTFLSPK